MGQNSKARRDQKKKVKAKNSKPIDGIVRKLNKDRYVYSQEWNVSASYYEQEGHYDWMSSQIEGYNRVLEIGCGVGYSTLSLARNGHKVVSIEENPDCLQATKELLETHGINVVLCKRESIKSHSNGQYTITYSALDTLPDSVVILIEGDVLGDINLIKWLKANEPFDAVVCWLMGTHGSRTYNKCLDTSKVSSSMMYRLKVQNSVYELADQILRTGGVLQAVDRAQSPDSQILKDDVIRSHKDQASVTSLQVDSMAHRAYTEPSKANAIKMEVGIPLSGEIHRDFSPQNMAFISVKSIKP